MDTFNRTDTLSELRHLTEIALYDNYSSTNWEGIMHLLYSCLLNAVPKKLRTNLQGSTLTPGGEALDPFSAMSCIADHVRTRMFIRGIYRAIRDCKKRFPHRKINILYAGCGPLAPLIMGLTQFFDSEEIEITLLDIHKISCEMSSSIIQTLGIEKYFSPDEAICEDATSFRWDKPYPLDIVITEVMAGGLKREPQVLVSANLSSQLSEGGILIPNKITLGAYLVPNEVTTDISSENFIGHPKVEFVGDIMSLTKEQLSSIFQYITSVGTPCILPLPSLTLSTMVNDTHLYVAATVETYNGHIIRPNTSDITRISRVRKIPNSSSGTTLSLGYQISGFPGVILHD